MVVPQSSRITLRGTRWMPGILPAEIKRLSNVASTSMERVVAQIRVVRSPKDTRFHEAWQWPSK